MCSNAICAPRLSTAIWIECQRVGRSVPTEGFGATSALSRCPLLAGPEYAALMDGIQDIDPESEDGQEIASTIQRLDKLCAP
jgi:hypothetical protein